MKFKKMIATGLAAVTLLGTAVTTVNAANMELTRKSYVYNAKGKKTKVFYRKGKKIKTLGTKKIKGKKYYRVGKNKYILIANFQNLKPEKSDNLSKNDDQAKNNAEVENQSTQDAQENNNWVDPTQKAIEEHDREMKEKANQFGDFINNKQ